MLKDEIVEHANTFKAGFGSHASPKHHEKRNPVIWNKVLEATNFLPEDAAPNQRFWHIMHEVWHRPLDKFCGAPLTWFHGNYRGSVGKGSNNRYPYNKTKSQRTSIKNWGFENPAQSPIIKAKMAATNLEKYGHVNYFGSKEGLEFLKEYWSDPKRRTERFAKIKATILEKYGCWLSQDQDIFEKITKNGMKYRPYVMPSGEVIQIQGYECYALDDLFTTGFKESQIIIGKRNMPEIWYEFEGTRRRYYPDIYIPEYNVIIEVKSDFSYKYQEAKNLAKQAEVLKRGYNFEFLIYSFYDVKERIRNKSIPCPPNILTRG
jgi:hypothetical protein